MLIELGAQVRPAKPLLDARDRLAAWNDSSHIPAELIPADNIKNLRRMHVGSSKRARSSPVKAPPSAAPSPSSATRREAADRPTSPKTPSSGQVRRRVNVMKPKRASTSHGSTVASDATANSATATDPTKPVNHDEYRKWAKETLKIDFSERLTEARYTANVAVIDDVVQASAWYRDAEAKLAAINTTYSAVNKESLWMGEPTLRLNKKPFLSMVDKSFRMNVVENPNFPNPPEKGWVTPDNWFSRMNDTIRTTLVCRFLDAPEYACQAIKAHAGDCGLSSHYTARGRDEGYYSHHLYIPFLVDVLTVGGTEQQAVELEIQVTTQLQDILKNLTHRYYSEDRSLPPNKDWKWEFRTNRFRARFLGHSLHLLEALIVDVRESKS